MAVETGRIIRPQPGPQENFLASAADIAVIGGAAGGGKTYSLVMEPLRHMGNEDFGAVIFRRENPQIRQKGGLWDTSVGLYTPFGARPRESTLDWLFPSPTERPGFGMSVKFAQMQYARDRMAWDGAQIPLIGFDQLESFEAVQFWYMFSKNRSTCGIKPYLRANCNPVPDDDPVGGWLNKLISWWIDPETGYAIRQRSGIIRWFVRDDVSDEIHWADNRADLVARFGPSSEPVSFTFIPSTLDDNPALDKVDPGYRSKLMAMQYVERERLLGGNWKIRPTAGKIFNRAWFDQPVGAAPAVARRVRYWDKASTPGGGDYSAGVRMAMDGGLYYVEDVVRGQWSPRDRNAVILQTANSDGPDVPIWMEQEGGSGGRESADISIQELAGYIVHTETVSGSKLTRASAFACQAEAHNVKLVSGPWNAEYLDELHRFTGADGGRDDQVDASSGAFNKLALVAPVRIWGGTGATAKTPAEAEAEAKRMRDESERLVREAVQRGGSFWPGG